MSADLNDATGRNPGHRAQGSASLAIVRWLLRRRKRHLERLVIGVPNYERRHSLELVGGARVTSDAELTVATIRAKGWECVRLAPRSKKPDGARWQITRDADEVASWFAHGANVGLVCHERTGVAVLDPDDLLPWADVIDMLGQPCLPWVITGSGKLHYYVRWEPELPAKLIWCRAIIGEVQRGPGMQQVVLPGSIHPSGGTYRWITERLAFLCEPIDPVADPLPRLNGEWLAWLRSHVYR